MRAVVVLLVLVFFYLLLLGDLVYQKRSPSATSSAIVCEFFAGTCFVTVVGRLLRIANTLDNQTPAHALARVLCTVGVFLFATTYAQDPSVRCPLCLPTPPFCACSLCLNTPFTSSSLAMLS